jgi:hypothetical protein
MGQIFDHFLRSSGEGRFIDDDQQNWSFLGADCERDAAPTWAQEGKATKIHFAFKSYYERIRPGYAEGIVDVDATVILSNRNNFKKHGVRLTRWPTRHGIGHGRSAKGLGTSPARIDSRKLNDNCKAYGPQQLT